jgi:hypothetical protein
MWSPGFKVCLQMGQLVPLLRRGASVSFYQEYDWAEGESSGGLQTAELRELPCGLLSVDVTLNGRD